jgi:hypothetical protein
MAVVVGNLPLDPDIEQPKGCSGNSVEQIHRSTQPQFLRMVERINAARSKPEPEPPPPNVRQLKP